MTLQKQTLALPIVGGLNEKEDALLSLHPQQMTNCVYRKSGAVSKRYGYTCIGRYNLRSDASAPASGELLATFRDELLRIGGGRVDSFQIVNGASDWIVRGEVSPLSVAKTPITSASLGLTYRSNPVVAYANGYTIAAYLSQEGTYRLFVDVFNTATGARVYSQYLVDSRTSGQTLENPRVEAIGTTAGVFWKCAGDSKIYGKFLNLTTMVWGTTATASNSSAGIPAFDVQAISDTSWLLACCHGASANYIYVLKLTTTISGGYFTQVAGTTAVAGTTIPNPTCISLRYVAGERIWCALSYDFNAASVASAIVQVFTLKDDASLTLEAPVYTSYTAASAYGAQAVAIERVSASKAALAWYRSDHATSWQEINYTAGPDAVANGYAVPRVLERAQLVSRPFVRDGRTYAIVVNVHGTHGTHFVVDLLIGESMASGTSAKLAAVAIPRQVGLPIQWATYPAVPVAPRYRSTSNVSPTSASDYIFATTTSDAAGYAVAGLRLSFTPSRTSAATSALLIIGGGIPTGYDGARTFELGFAYEPDSSYLAAMTIGSGAGLTSGITYNYKFVYVWKDAGGNDMRSIPSTPAVSVAATAGNGVASGTVPPLQITNRGAIPFGTTPGSLRVEIYRTGSSGGVATSTYKLVTSVPNAAGAPIAFTDNMSDTTLDSQIKLYTTGGVLDHASPPSANIAFAWKNAILLAGTDDDSIWISGEIVDGEGPWFSDSTAISPFEGGTVTALSSLDATLVIFKADGIWIVDGEPPNDLGISTLTAPRRVQTDVGCVDAASIVQTPEGVYFKGRTALYLLNRSLQVIPVGRAVEDSYRTSGFAGAVTLPAQGLVRWMQRGSGGFDVLNLDAYHTAIYGQPVWSKDVLFDVRVDDAARAVACTVWRGAFVWLSLSGYLYQESTTSFGDDDGIAAPVWVSMTFETSVEKAASLSELERVWRAHVLGNYVSPHGLTVTLTTDRGAESRTWTSTEIAAFVGLPVEKFLLHVAQQKCQWMRVKIADAPPLSGAYGTAAGMTLRDISLVLGVKGKGARVPAANRK